jgi:hypothetical protein
VQIRTDPPSRVGASAGFRTGSRRPRLLKIRAGAVQVSRPIGRRRATLHRLIRERTRTIQWRGRTPEGEVAAATSPRSESLCRLGLQRRSSIAEAHVAARGRGERTGARTRACSAQRQGVAREAPGVGRAAPGVARVAVRGECDARTPRHTLAPPIPRSASRAPRPTPALSAARSPLRSRARSRSRFSRHRFATALKRHPMEGCLHE